MNYDVVIIGAGLTGFSSALAVINQGLRPVIVSKGMGNLYSSTGFIDLLGYHPLDAQYPVENLRAALQSLCNEKVNHPYSIVGDQIIAEAVAVFLQASKEMGLPYSGGLEKNKLLPTAAGSLIPVALYPCTSGADIQNTREIAVLGLRDLIDFFPQFTADNLQKFIRTKITAIWGEIGLNYHRGLQSYDLALALEKKEIRQKLINNLKKDIKPGALVIAPAVFGIHRWQEVIADIENNLQCRILEIPTLPPSVLGCRLAEALKTYLEAQGVEFVIGSPVVNYINEDRNIKAVCLEAINGRTINISGKSFVLATGGILGEGLRVSPRKIEETIFGLPTVNSTSESYKSFFDLRGQPFAYGGILVNNRLQPLDSNKKQAIFANLYAAGALLANYDPFIEKSGNGVALVTGYKAGLEASGGWNK